MGRRLALINHHRYGFATISFVEYDIETCVVASLHNNIDREVVGLKRNRVFRSLGDGGSTQFLDRAGIGDVENVGAFSVDLGVVEGDAHCLLGLNFFALEPEGDVDSLDGFDVVVGHCIDLVEDGLRGNVRELHLDAVGKGAFRSGDGNCGAADALGKVLGVILDFVFILLVGVLVFLVVGLVVLGLVVGVVAFVGCGLVALVARRLVCCGLGIVHCRLICRRFVGCRFISCWLGLICCGLGIVRRRIRLISCWLGFVRHSRGLFCRGLWLISLCLLCLFGFYVVFVSCLVALNDELFCLVIARGEGSFDRRRIPCHQR